MDKLNKILPWIICLAVVVIQRCDQENAIDTMQRDHASEMSYMREENNALIQKDLEPQVVVEKDMNVISEEKAREMLDEQFKEFTEINMLLKGEIVTAVENISIEYHPPDVHVDPFEGLDFALDGYHLHKDTVNKYFLRTPKKVSYLDTNWLEFEGTVFRNDFNIDRLSLINKFDVTLGYKKPDKNFKFLRRSEPKLEFKSYNPYSTVPYVNNLVVEKNGSAAGRIFTSKPAFFVYGFLAKSLINVNQN